MKHQDLHNEPFQNHKTQKLGEIDGNVIFILLMC